MALRCGGPVALAPTPGVGELMTLYVEPEHRGRGATATAGQTVAAQLFSAALADLAASGCSAAELYVAPRNLAAQAFYIGRGFERIRTDIIRGKPALLFSKPLAS